MNAEVISLRQLSVIEQIRAKVRAVQKRESNVQMLSTSEKIAVGLVLDRPEIVGQYGTLLEGVERLGAEWLKAAYYVQRNGWAED